jgi:phage shock protein PspC (stress-responsive transcriptional regulator)
MKKTVNINLAGTFFHIDEDAFGKLSRYLDAIRKSLTEPQGSDEIMRDIEARISELFSEKIESQSQVISLKELDQVIAVMGQPEDYSVDEALFDDAPHTGATYKRAGYKQLFRDIDNKFISGVSSGLGHYLGIDAIWVRLLWILLTIFSSGIFILVYILFWILVPPAETTAEKLKMTGEPVNISNIEKKFKEGYDAVASTVKNADYDKYGRRVKSGATGFFETLGSILLTLFKIFVKFIGVVLILVSLSTLIGLLIGLFTFGSIDIWGTGEISEYIALIDTTSTPLWILSLLTFLAVGIPFFVLFILGMKMLISNLRSIGTTAKIVLFALWILALVGLGIIGLRQATAQAYDGDSISETTVPVRPGETLQVAMRADTQYEYEVYRHGDFTIKYTSDDEPVLYSNDVRLIVRSTTDSVGKLIVEKSAQGKSFKEARQRAEDINYQFDYQNNTLLLDGFYTSDLENKYRDQEVELILYLPVGSYLIAEENTYSFHRNDSRYNDILDNGDEGKTLLILNNDTRCVDCLEQEDESLQTRSGEVKYGDWELEVNRRLDPNKTPSRGRTREIDSIALDSLSN